MPSAAPAHAVFFPYPAQGHVAAALHLARLLHARAGIRVTFVHSERNRRRVARSRGEAALAGARGFRFAAVPDGLPLEHDDYGPPDTLALLLSIEAGAFVPHFKKILEEEAAASGAPATCVVSDVDLALLAAKDMGLPAVAFWTPSACALMASLQCKELVDRGIVPLKDAEQLSNGYLDRTVVDWVPGMPADMRLRDFVSFVRTTDPDDAVLGLVVSSMERLRTASSAVILNTFDALEGEVIAALSRIVPPIYTVGPLPQLAGASAASHVDPPPAAAEDASGGLAASFWLEDGGCLEWLRRRRPRSVLYVNFGSIVCLTSQQLVELAWGLAASGHDFLWVIRDDQAKVAAGGGGDGDDAIAMLPVELRETVKGKGYLTSWCPQEAVLRHDAIGAFLTHCGWNSMLEAVANGVPMLCYPMGADQQTNCRYACTEWRVGVEVGDGIERGEVARMVREVLGQEGERGKEMRQRAMGWKERAAMAVVPGGTSWVNFERLVNEVFSPGRNNP
ncbi:(R)-mandelonitrile beta-glucosyltransferase-like [Oryza brachyantha]|uniref:(R)-mandelonitrile beta-glucosyltransferase-like n=1 Tax=Oryza brachyantha TaxID=4533 RepID=UPI001ADC4DF3|nr:(R)-mandelonitrile beta-glucosyltransferase-like [Oryza brachyantha]